MTDVDHELGAIRFVVDAPLSSKVAMFNNVANQHKESQFLNPFSNAEHKQRTFNKDDYGKPLAGSLTEMRGARANIHVCKEMLQLCQIIDTEGFPFKDEPNLKVILFGDLFNIYTLISDKVVGLLLRARKYKLIDFEGEVLFQRRDDDVPVYLLKPIDEIKQILEDKQEEVRRSVSPAPQPTTNLLDRRSASPAPTRGNLSRSASPAPQQDSSNRGRSPAPIQRDRSVSPAPQLNQQNNLSRSVSPAPQEKHHSRSVSPAIKQSNGNASRSVSPAPTIEISSCSNLDELNPKQNVSSAPELKLDTFDLKNTPAPAPIQNGSISPASQTIITTTDSQ